jgi:hypothetical protein
MGVEYVVRREMRNAYTILDGKKKGKTLWGPRSRCKENVKVDLKEIVCEVIGSSLSLVSHYPLKVQRVFL